MSERDTISRLKERQGVLAKIQNVLGLGYATKEDLRELDKKLRDCFYADFKSLRHKWEEIYSSALDAGQNELGDDLKKVIQIIDRVAEKVNRADYGYAGLMDRKGHIREEELARAFDLDKTSGVNLEAIDKSVDDLYKDSEARL